MKVSVVTSIGAVRVEDLPGQLGVELEIARLRQSLERWVESPVAELRPMLRWQLEARAKFFRPMTIFACQRAMFGRPAPSRIMRSAIALELMHNVSLIVDDILDRSRHRRGRLTLHCRFGALPALMTSGFIHAGAFARVANDSYSVGVLAELVQRLAVAECVQWRLRRHPLGVEDWRGIAGEDTGSMFEVCAALGTRDARLRPFGRLLGILYHGCDDVGDMRGASALGGGGDEDLRDGIVTLPIALAIRNPQVALMFRNPRPGDTRRLIRHVVETLDEAEDYLDGVAREAEQEALRIALHPEPLLRLIHHTRALSRS